MCIKTHKMAMMVVALCLSFAYPAQAIYVFDFQPAVGDWDGAENWTANGIGVDVLPGRYDHTNIVNNSECTLNTTTTVARRNENAIHSANLFIVNSLEHRDVDIAGDGRIERFVAEGFNLHLRPASVARRLEGVALPGRDGYAVGRVHDAVRELHGGAVDGAPDITRASVVHAHVVRIVRQRREVDPARR